ncbi:Ig-like domain-containing protein [Steroidobacter sp.]|uniref:Ig-like domain-containing protein n=1 Tax=Steroidobacter sp. TaxID=1978227 RepID=UPI001A5965A6|nr:hypothetical protein [Steroidobacter sp.]MBL8268554.1 hypothetical protein [Steroidobacter sp.]
MSHRYTQAFVPLCAALMIAGCGGGSGGGGSSTAPPMSSNTAPKITDLASTQSIAQDESGEALAFSISDAESSASDLTLKVESSSDLISADAVRLSGNGAARTLTITPEDGVSGAATVKVTATDPSGASTSSTVNVTVASEQRSFTEMVNTAYTKSIDDEPESVTGYSWVDNPTEDPDAFDALLE